MFNNPEKCDCILCGAEAQKRTDFDAATVFMNVQSAGTLKYNFR